MTPPSRLEWAIRIALVLMGAITATPALALVDAYTLEVTYQVTEPEPMALALLQHRGMLQLVLGAALVWAAFFPPVRIGAACAAIATKATFLALILPDPALRSDLAPFSTFFDLTCIVLLTGLLAREIDRAAKRRREVTAWSSR